MKKALLFIVLYVYAAVRSIAGRHRIEPDGLCGLRVFLFVDPANPKAGVHGVVAFVLGKNAGTEQFSEDLWGPFGYTSDITLRGYHLYGRDTWGIATGDQILANYELKHIAKFYPGHTILLAGVRKIGGHHPWPLNDPSKFILPWK